MFGRRNCGDKAASEGEDEGERELHDFRWRGLCCRMFDGRMSSCRA